jgi:type II secretory pathway predicted ATPase ExeA
MTFADALQLLGEGGDPAVERLGRLAGIGAGVVTVATAGTVDFFALRDEAVRWGSTVVGTLRGRLRGLQRFDRTQRLAAAHSVIVLTSFYAALGEDAWFDLPAARIVAEEQVAIAVGGAAAQSYVEMIGELVAKPPPMPAAHLPFEDVCEALSRFYQDAANSLQRFLIELGPAQGIRRPGGGFAQSAVTRYVEAYRALSAQAPEFGVWAGMVDAQATRFVVRASAAEIGVQLAELRAGIADLAGETADATRTGLGKRYRARLERSILSSAAAPAHVVLPTLRQGYVVPRGRVAIAGRADLPAAESWWERGRPVPDVQALLLAHLTGPDATGSPLVVLGQPGSGKSVLTRMLAAGLPESDFLVVRVELRNVHADASPQAQIESAVMRMLGERVTWPELVRRAGRALPVVIMDGFDELLQATGVNRADYLEQLQEFQQREAELDRPVAVLVTSRTVVADRARFPEETVVVRLEPFDDEQVRHWLAVWNDLNAAALRARSLRTLPAEVALLHGELARQPLLLLLLALYDAGANALQSAGRGIGRVELYERLFSDFIDRELDKHDGGGTAEQRALDVDREWRRLCAVAVAMLNRGGDVITEPELDADVRHLLHADDLMPASSPSLNRALTSSELLVGRFFFIHESRAARDTGAPERTFEFLHATFGEFLAARQIVAALVELVEERRSRRRRTQSVLDAGFLYAVTSFVTVTRRGPLFEFCQNMLTRLEPGLRRACRELALELLPDAGYPHPTWSVGAYEPRRKPFAARHAAFSANLVSFAVILADGPSDVVELVGEPVVEEWKALALLWQSQLDGTDRQRIWQSFRVVWRLDRDPTRLEIRVEDGTDIGVHESLPWPPDDRPVIGAVLTVPDVAMPADSATGRALRKSAFVQTAFEVREHLYALMPFWRTFGDSATKRDVPFTSADGALLQLLLTPPGSQPELERSLQFRTAVAMSPTAFYDRLILRQLAEEANTLGDFGLTLALQAFHDLNVAGGDDLLARLTAAVATRRPLDPTVLRAIRNYLFRLQGDNAGMAMEMTRAFASVGAPVPDWVRTAPDGLNEP